MIKHVFLTTIKAESLLPDVVYGEIEGNNVVFKIDDLKFIQATDAIHVGNRCEFVAQQHEQQFRLMMQVIAANGVDYRFKRIDIQDAGKHDAAQSSTHHSSEEEE